MKLSSIFAAAFAMLVLGAMLFSQHVAYANNPGKAITSIAVSSPADGHIQVLWGAPIEGPADYRISWALDSVGGITTYTAENSSTGGNAYPSGSGTSYLITGLDPGAYRVWVRARYEDWENGDFKKSPVVHVAGPDPKNTDDGTKGPKDPPPPPVIIVQDVTPEPTEEPEFALQQDQEDIVHPANTLVSNINNASSGSYTVIPYQDVAIQLPPPAPQESLYEDVWNLNTIRIRVSGVDAGEGLSGRLRPQGGSSSGPATGVGGPAGKRFTSVSVSSDGIATFSNPSPSGYNPKSENFYFIVSVNSGEIEVGKVADATLDAGTPNSLNLGPTWHQANNSWSADPTTTDRIQILITGSVKPVNVSEPEPTPVPSRPSTPNDGVPTYSIGSWRSVTLKSGDAFGDATYKVRLQKDTNYRVEFRTANSYASATASDAGMFVTNNLVDLSAITSGTGSPFILEVGEDRNPTTTLYRATSWFRHGPSALKEGIWSDVLYQDFRTPNVYDHQGNAACDEITEVLLVQRTDCVYQYDYPNYYYLNIGTGIGRQPGAHGTMQFRISRISDQSIVGMSRMEMDSEPSFHSPNYINDAVTGSDGVEDVDKHSANGEIDFAGDVDWYIPSQSLTACSIAVAGSDTNPASGLRIRIYDRIFTNPVVPNNRGSFRTSLTGVAPSDGERLLEVTGSSAGGYQITVACEASSSVSIPNLDQDGRQAYPGYDDYRPARNLNELVIPTPTYGEIDMTGRTSNSATGSISDYNDEDSFKVTATAGRRYSITLTPATVTLPIPSLLDNNAIARFQGLVLSGSAQPYAIECDSDESAPSSIKISVQEFDVDDKPANIKADLHGAVTCMFIRVGLVDRYENRVGGYRITVRDEGLIPHPARADAHSPLMYDSEDRFLIGGSSPGMHVFITGETHTTYTNGIEVIYSSSRSYGSTSSTARMDSYDDIDIFRKRVSPGLHDVFIQSESPTSHHENGLAVGFSVMQGLQGTEPGRVVDLTPGDDRFDSVATPGATLCANVGRESYIELGTNINKTRDIWDCKRKTVATFEAEYSGYYYVAAHLQRSPDFLGTYRVEMRRVSSRAPSLTGLSNASDTTSRNLNVKATVRNPRNTPVYLQYRKQGETDWQNREINTGDLYYEIIQQSLGVEFTIRSSDLEPGTVYNIRASLTADFSSGVRTLNIRTATDLNAYRVRASNVTHNSADVTVSVSNGRAGDYVKIGTRRPPTLIT